MPTTQLSSSDLHGQVTRLNQTLESVAEANAYAAELLIDLELTRSRLEEQNRALEQAKRAAEESDRCKSVFLATMSHELRTPLNAIIGYSEMLEEDARSLAQPQMVTDLGRIHSSARHLLSLINDLLDFSKIEAGRLELRLQPVPAISIIRNVAATVAPLLQKNGNRLVSHCPEDSPPVLADPLRLNQCLLNLLSNAAKFTSEGEVVLDAHAEGASFLFVVRDNGIGIEPEFLAHLFEPFRQAGGSEVRTQSGTGLGLAISRKLARLMGGDLTAESRRGAGSTFTLSLPAATLPAGTLAE